MADTAAGVLAPAVIALLKNLWSVFKNPDDIREELGKGLRTLRALRTDNDNEVSSHIARKYASAVYNTWRDHVLDIEKEVTSLTTKYDEVKGEKWHLLRKRRLGKKMEKKLSVVIKLLDKCPKDNILVDRLQKDVIQKAVEDIKAQLQRNEVKCVALSGGERRERRTIMQLLNNHFDGRGDFDMVIFIQAEAHERTELHFLRQIADRLKVGGEVKELEVAQRIQKVLANKRYLMILDNAGRKIQGIWDKLDISKAKKGSKVVITLAARYPLDEGWKKRVDKIETVEI